MSYKKSPAEQMAEFITPSSRRLAQNQAEINITLNSGAPIHSIGSASHVLESQTLNNEKSSYFITLNPDQTGTESRSHSLNLPGRTFNLNWQLQPSKQPLLSSFVEQIDGEYYTLLTLFPPQVSSDKTIPRDIIFIIDTSGSMQGSSMSQAKSSLQQALSQLSEKDSFNIIAFDNTVELLFKNTQMVTEFSKENASAFIENLNADGGTEMFRPLSSALIMQKSDEQIAQALRQIVFITDGAVANEFELMQLLDDARGNFRLFTVGIGAAPNGYFMKKAAQFGRGSYVFIQNSNQVQNKMSELMTKISQPAISNIQLVFDNQVHSNLDMYPKKIPDLYIGEPLQVAIKSELPITSLQLQGITSSTHWEQEVIVDDAKSSQGISTLWARRKIADLLDSLVTGADKNIVKERVIVTSITHQTISPYTSFIAVEKQPIKDYFLARQLQESSQVIPNTRLLVKQGGSVALPQTALGWQQQLIFGCLLIVLAKLTELLWIHRRAKRIH